MEYIIGTELEVTWQPSRDGRDVAAEKDDRFFFRRRTLWQEKPRVGSTWLVRIVHFERGNTFHVVGVREIDPGNGAASLAVPEFPAVLTFEPGDRGDTVAFNNGVPCLPCKRGWTGKLPTVGERWEVRLVEWNPRRTVCFVSPVRFVERDPDFDFPHNVAVIFQQGRQEPIALIDGRVSLPCSRLWTMQRPADQDEWRVTVVGVNRLRTLYFLAPLEYCGKYNPLRNLPPLPSRLIVQFVDGGADGVCAWIRDKRAIAVEAPPEGNGPRPGEHWAVEIVGSDPEGYRIRPFICVGVPPLMTAPPRTDGLPGRQIVRFKPGRRDDLIAFIDDRTLALPDPRVWTARLPQSHELWMVDVTSMNGKACYLAPVCCLGVGG